MLNAIGIKHTINPEYEAARVLAQKLPLDGILNLFSISESLKIIDLPVPKSLIGSKFSPTTFKKDTHLKIIAFKRDKHILYTSSQLKEDQDIADLEYRNDDILVLVGELKDIRKFLHE